MDNYDLNTDIMMITIMSFLGFCIEDTWMLVRYSYIDNRNMYLPFLLGYGLLMNGLYYVVGTPDNIFGGSSHPLKYEYPLNCIVYFFICMAVVSVGEIILGTFVEKTGGFEYWNYSAIPLHITKYTSVPTSAGFALIMTLFMHYMYVPLRASVHKAAAGIPTPYIIMLAAVLFIDFFSSFTNMYQNHGSNSLWKFEADASLNTLRDMLKFGR